MSAITCDRCGSDNFVQEKPYCLGSATYQVFRCLDCERTFEVNARLSAILLSWNRVDSEFNNKGES